MKKIFGRIISSLLCLVLVITLLPVQVHAGYEDGAECEYCGGYRFDDWLCDDGPHCSENSDSSDCYEAHHCKECGESFEEDELCEYCGFCEECARAEQGYHCIECGEHFGDTCQECYHCIDCALEKGYHCEFCMECGMNLDPCGIHPFGNDAEAHCIQCSPTCMECGECFGEDPSEFCFFCEKCWNCALDSGTHCGICEWCYEGEMCDKCYMCDECAVDEGAHCENCGIHVEDWCASGGEGTHCIECAAEFTCAQCEECTQCLELDFCEYCGLCVECCIQNAVDAGCSCGDYCIEGSGWDEHFCEECATCFDDVDACEYCGLCVDCCEQITECSSGMCVEDPDYDQHFCEECNECFDNVEMCESCYDGGYGICEDCCAQLTEAEGCEHGCCTNSWEWDEHYCYNCGMCFEICGCPPLIHSHDYDEDNICTICHARKDGGPVIARQPEDARCMVFDTEDPAYLNNYVTFNVKAVGEDLSYQWYNASSGQALTDDQTGPGGIKQCAGAKTDTFTVFVAPDACSTTYRFYCIVTNEKGSAQTDTVKIDADHNFNAYAYDKSESFKVVYDKLILGDREVERSKTFYVSDTHWKTCSGCDAAGDEAEHRLGPWMEGKEPNEQFDGYKYKTCYDCGYEYGCVLPKLTEPHVHDFTYDYSQGNDFHWGQCACAKEDKTTMERHTYSDWVTAIEPTISTGGTEERECTVCGHTESRETKPQGHVHHYYDWDYINENGYIDNDSLNVPYMEPYGKTDKNYHYAYCVASGCKEYTKIAHNFDAPQWIIPPTATQDGVFHKECGGCGYSLDGKCSANQYLIMTQDCRSNVQVARPGMTVKLYPLKNYPAGEYFADDFDVTYTDNNGAYGSWKQIACEYHNAGTDDAYWTFTMPELPEGATLDTCWVEAIAVVYECNDHELVWANVVKETCGTPGYTGDYMCKLCNYVEEAGTTVPPTGEHGEFYLDNVKEGSCTKRAYSGDKVCEDCGKILEKGHYTDFGHGNIISDADKPKLATCTENGYSLQYICEDCGKVTKRREVIKKLGHKWEAVEEIPSTCIDKGTVAYFECTACDAVSLDGEKELYNTAKLLNPAFSEHKWSTAAGTGEKECTVCGKSQESVKEKVSRIYGKTRYETSYAIADALKVQLGVSKFEAVIVANGKNFPDALAGSYLANRKNAPILMASEKNIASLEEYIVKSLIKGGRIYVLGGEAAVPESVVSGLAADYEIKRLAGSSRYETNLEILKEAGVGREEILICTGRGFADSLSVSATGKPILLVGKSLTEAQKEFLGSMTGNALYIIGGSCAVSADIESEVKKYGEVKRISGASRYDTSVAVAEEFFDTPAQAVLAYAKNFPDGLCGGPLAYSKNAPLILTADGKQAAAVQYSNGKKITYGAVLGGASLISDTTANEILGEK